MCVCNNNINNENKQNSSSGEVASKTTKSSGKIKTSTPVRLPRKSFDFSADESDNNNEGLYFG